MHKGERKPPRRSLALTPLQLQRILEVVQSFGFVLSRVEVLNSGAVILHGQGEPVQALDPLAEWEAKRGARLH